MGGKPDVGIGFRRNMFFSPDVMLTKINWGIFIIPLSRTVFQSYILRFLSVRQVCFWGPVLPPNRKVFGSPRVWTSVFFHTLGIQSYSQLIIGVSNHLLSIVFRFHYHSQKVIGSLGTGHCFFSNQLAPPMIGWEDNPPWSSFFLWWPDGLLM